jgi:hypothetical protein
MAPAPSEPRATTFSSRDPVVHRPFGLFAAASDLLAFRRKWHASERLIHERLERIADAEGVGRRRNEGCEDPSLVSGEIEIREKLGIRLDG